MQNDNSKILEAKNLEKFYLTTDVKTIALDKINFSVNKGEMLGIKGASGSGKSTLLGIIGLLVDPSGGELYLDGELVSNLSDSESAVMRRDNIGFVFQNFNLLEELTIFENVELPLVYSNIDKVARKPKVDAMLERLGIAHRANHFPSQLSGGQQQRVAIARAVVSDPKIILADEPTGNLDSENRKEVIDLLAEFNKDGTTVIMVSHSEDDVARCSRLISLKDGKIQELN